MKTGNKSLDAWVNFFDSKKDMNRFIALLQKRDKSFLSFENTFDFEHSLFEKISKWGFLEEDLKKILNNNNKQGEICIDEKTRLVLAMAYGVNFKYWHIIYKEELIEIFEKSLIEAQYEKYGIDLEKIISKAINNKLINANDFMSIAVLRGVILQNRYPKDQDLSDLQKTVYKNKIKIKIYKLFN